MPTHSKIAVVAGMPSVVLVGSPDNAKEGWELLDLYNDTNVLIGALSQMKDGDPRKKVIISYILHHGLPNDEYLDEAVSLLFPDPNEGWGNSWAVATIKRALTSDTPAAFAAVLEAWTNDTPTKLGPVHYLVEAVETLGDGLAKWSEGTWEERIILAKQTAAVLDAILRNPPLFDLDYDSHPATQIRVDLMATRLAAQEKIIDNYRQGVGQEPQEEAMVDEVSRAVLSSRRGNYDDEGVGTYLRLLDTASMYLKSVGDHSDTPSCFEEATLALRWARDAGTRLKAVYC
jgi:hypothetical protein